MENTQDSTIEIYWSSIEDVCAKFSNGAQKRAIRTLGERMLNEIQTGRGHKPEQLMAVFETWLAKLSARDTSRRSVAMFSNKEIDILLEAFQTLALQASLYAYLLEPHTYTCLDARPYTCLNRPAVVQPLSQSTPVPPPPPLPSREERARMCMELVAGRVEELGADPMDDEAVNRLCVTDEVLRTRIERYVDNVTE